MRILVLGADGYLGWPTAIHLSMAGHDVAVSDNFVRRTYDEEMGVSSLTPIATFEDRVAAWTAGRRQEDQAIRRRSVRRRVRAPHGRRLPTRHDRALRRAALGALLDDRPGRMPSTRRRTTSSAPSTSSTRSRKSIATSISSSSARWASTAPPTSTSRRAGSTINHKGRTDTRACIPKRPGSFYHLSKVHDSHNIEFACRIWGLRATDLNQGVVYGVDTETTNSIRGSPRGLTTTACSAPC